MSRQDYSRMACSHAFCDADSMVFFHIFDINLNKTYTEPRVFSLLPCVVWLNQSLVVFSPWCVLFGQVRKQHSHLVADQNKHAKTLY